MLEVNDNTYQTLDEFQKWNIEDERNTIQYDVVRKN
jgi:hypothetical protein